MADRLSRFTSRRFLFALASFILIPIQILIPVEYRLNDTVILGLVGIVMGYMCVDSWVKIKDNSKSDKPNETGSTESLGG